MVGGGQAGWEEERPPILEENSPVDLPGLLLAPRLLLLLGEQGRGLRTFYRGDQ